ncbi:MAG: NAD(P)/FAD-dependent oxidoreductase [Oscillospiraceae bacterium]|nr:NAD(P)/FAD-dependent oxidoreductase [Oscillospiraceae bacterium]
MYDAAVIGAGVVGGLIARELSRYRLKTVLLEKAPDVAMGTSKANSAIVHAGFDAPVGSNKAKFNVLGNALMEQVTGELEVPFRRNGSMVLAFGPEDEAQLQELYNRGIQNGVPGLRLLTGEETRAMEPAVSQEVTAALLAPTGGIVCPYELTIAACGNAMDNGAELETEFEVVSAEKTGEGWKLTASSGKAVEARYVVNAAGLFSDRVAALFDDDDICIHPRRGEYLLLDRTQGGTADHTLFQTPSVMGKGILVTPTVDGNLLLGPTSEDIEDKEDFSTTREGLDKVAAMAARSVPSVSLRSVITSFTGLRACEKGHDFIIRPSKKAPGVLQLSGIESPGLSAAPALAKEAVRLLGEMGCPLEPNPAFDPHRPHPPKFRTLSNAERAALIQKDPRYGRIICRCETVTEGEIVAAIHRNPPARDLDGVKRRTRTGMGRCQGGFCTPSAVEILARELGIPTEQVTKSGGGSRLLTGKTREGGEQHD